MKTNQKTKYAVKQLSSKSMMITNKGILLAVVTFPDSKSDISELRMVADALSEHVHRLDVVLFEAGKKAADEAGKRMELEDFKRRN